MLRLLARNLRRPSRLGEGDRGDIDDVVPILVGVLMLVLGGYLFLWIDISQVLVQEARPLAQQIATILASESYPTASAPGYASGLVGAIISSVDQRSQTAVPPFSCEPPSSQPAANFGSLQLPLVTTNGSGAGVGAYGTLHTVTVTLTCTAEWDVRGFDPTVTVTATQTYALQANVA